MAESLPLPRRPGRVGYLVKRGSVDVEEPEIGKSNSQGDAAFF